MNPTAEERDPVRSALFRVEASDPRQELINRAGVGPEDIRTINELMTALGELKRTEQALTEASLSYMKLNQTDMRALHYLIVAQNTEKVVTPGALAQHLNISTASTTKMLDRLEAGNHILRSPHPHDRRALTITITEESHLAAQQTVGRQQAKRFQVAAQFSQEQRTTVTNFIRAMADALTLGEDAEWAQGHTKKAAPAPKRPRVDPSEPSAT